MNDGQWSQEDQERTILKERWNLSVLLACRLVRTFLSSLIKRHKHCWTQTAHKKQEGEPSNCPLPAKCIQHSLCELRHYENAYRWPRWYNANSQRTPFDKILQNCYVGRIENHYVPESWQEAICDVHHPECRRKWGEREANYSCNWTQHGCKPVAEAVSEVRPERAEYTTRRQIQGSYPRCNKKTIKTFCRSIEGNKETKYSTVRNMWSNLRPVINGKIYLVLIVWF